MSSALQVVHARPTREVAAIFAGLAEPSRLELLRLLAAGPRTVGELVDATGIRQPSVSKHLACLHGCGLLERERQGRTAVYSICRPDVVTLVEAAERLCDEVRCDEACACPVCDEERR